MHKLNVLCIMYVQYIMYVHYKENHEFTHPIVEQVFTSKLICTAKDTHGFNHNRKQTQLHPPENETAHTHAE